MKFMLKQHVWPMIKNTFEGFSTDRVLKLSAALAYYTVFSLAPLLIIVIWVTSFFYDQAYARQEILEQMNRLLGAEAVKQLDEVMTKTRFDSASGWAQVLGIITLVLSATGIFGEIQDSINLIWGLKAKPKKGIIKMVVNRLLSFSLVLSLGFILVVSLMLNALIAALTGYIQRYMPAVPVELFYILNQALIFGVITFLFAAIFKVLPDAKIRWRDVMVSALVTAGFFMLGKYLIGFYLGRNATINAYGSAGSVIIILLWVYYSAMILYIGAEFTRAYLKVKGKHIEPNRYAEWVKKEEVEVDSNTQVKPLKKSG